MKNVLAAAPVLLPALHKQSLCCPAGSALSGKRNALAAEPVWHYAISQRRNLKKRDDTMLYADVIPACTGSYEHEISRLKYRQ